MKTEAKRKCNSYMAFSWTSPLSPRPCWLHRLPVRLHKVNHNGILFGDHNGEIWTSFGIGMVFI